LVGRPIKIAGHAAAQQGGMWIVAIAFTAVLCAKDLGWRGAHTG
jgi:hypothetical protein